MSLCEMAITVERARRAEIESVAEAVSREGVEVERVIPQLGTIYGRGEESCMARVGAVVGVERVRIAARVQLPPFDPSIPQ